MRKSLILALASALITTTYADPVRLEYVIPSSVTSKTGGAWGSKYWKNLSTGTTDNPWENGSIAVFNETEGQQIQNAQLRNGTVIEPYGIETKIVNSSNFKVIDASASQNGGVKLGAGGLVIKSFNINKVGFQFTKEFTLTDSQTWSNEDVSTGSTKYHTANVYVGANTAISASSYRYTPSSFTMASSKTLTLNAVNLVVTAPGDFAGASVYADAASGLCITTDGEANQSMLNAELITMDGSTLTLDANPDVAGDGQFNVARTIALKDGGKVVGANGLFDTPTVEVAGADNSISGTFAIAPSFALQGNGSLEIALKTRDDNITVTSLATYSGSGITVSGGTLEISHDAVWPDEFSVTLGDNGFLKFQTSADYEKHVNSITGKKENVVVVESEWRVDDLVTNAVLTVNVGQELHIYGNGLTATNTLILNGGTVIFEDSKTIASPITCNATSTIKTKDNTIVGTLSGFITADDDSSLNADPARNLLTLSGPGKIVLSGGGLFDHYAGLKLSGGCADVTSAIFRFGSVNESLANNRGGPILVTDNAEWLTIKDGGEVILTKQGSSTAAYQGLSKIDVANGQEGGMILDPGGTLTIEDLRYFYIGYNSRSTAKNYLKINGGTLSLPSSGGAFEVAHSQSKGFLEFNSGMFLANKSLKSNNTANGKVIWNGGTWKFSSNADNGIQRLLLTSTLPVEINGPNCILDISDVYKDRTISCCDADTDTSWKFGENGALTILGSKTNPTKFKINSVFTDSNIVLSNITAITTATVTGPTFASIGFKEGAKFDASLWTSSAEIGTLVIKEGGEWNGGENLVNATFNNLTFEDGAILNVTTDKTKEISGVLTLPGQMQYMITGNALPSHLAVFSATSGIVQVDPAKPSKTEWALVAGMRARGFGAPEVVDNTLVMDRFGSILFLR